MPGAKLPKTQPKLELSDSALLALVAGSVYYRPAGVSRELAVAQAIETAQLIIVVAEGPLA